MVILGSSVVSVGFEENLQYTAVGAWGKLTLQQGLGQIRTLFVICPLERFSVGDRSNRYRHDATSRLRIAAESASKSDRPNSPGRRRAGGIGDRHMRWCSLRRGARGDRAEPATPGAHAYPAEESLSFSEQALQISGQQQTGAAHRLL